MQKNFYSEYFTIEDRHWWFVGRRRILLRVLDRFLPSPAPTPRRILDVGCGTGTMLQYLAVYGNAEGADADSEAVQYCRQRGLENVRQLTGSTLPFPDGSFDLVTMLDVLEHIDDDLGTLREVYRVLSESGTVVLTVPAYRFLWGAQDEISFHKRRYRAREMKERLVAANFRVVKLSYFNTLLFPFIAAIRLGRRLKRQSSGELKSDFTLTRDGLTNKLLANVFGFERHFVTRMNLPFGVSIVAVAKKNG